MKASKVWRDKDQWEPKDIHSCSSCFSVCVFNNEIQLVVTHFCACLCMSPCVSCVCGQKGNTRSCNGLCLCLFVCVCLSLFVCLCLYVCMCFLCVRSKRKYKKLWCPQDTLANWRWASPVRQLMLVSLPPCWRKKSKYKFFSFLLERRSIQNTSYSYFPHQENILFFPANSSRPKFRFKISTKLQPEQKSWPNISFKISTKLQP